MKLWQTNPTLDKDIEEFTIGEDFYLDNELIEFDCMASIIHAEMLNNLGYLNDKEFDEIQKKLLDWESIEINPGDEDCHTAIENHLGEVGKKIHLGRSRNDQVIMAMKLYQLKKIDEVKKAINNITKILDKQIHKFGEIIFPGFTHMQLAMTTDVKTWLGSYKESLSENLDYLEFIVDFISKSPMGSGAGYGVPIDYDKKFVAHKLGLKVIENPIYSQATRSKYDIQVLGCLTSIMYDLNKISTDLITFNLLKYIKLQSAFCTGSSIMPHKKNPDVLELIRGKYHIVHGNEIKYKTLVSNLMMGYNRDIQLTKKLIYESFNDTISCLNMMSLVMDGLIIEKLELPKELYATDKVYELVKNGMPFRDAYKKIAKEWSK